MPHSRHILNPILAKIEEAYQKSAGYEIRTELSVPGTRYFPDIAVYKECKLIAAVEIGYTRPEKLSAYRQMGAIDVRWYAKDGTLHQDVVEKTVVENRIVRNTMITSPGDALYAYYLNNKIGCPEPECRPESSAYLEELAARYLRRFKKDADLDYRISNADDGSDYIDVLTTCVTDYVRLWILNFCDKCGKHWLSTEDDDGFSFDLIELFKEHNPRDIGLAIGTRSDITWKEFRESAEFGVVNLDLAEDIWLDNGVKQYHRNVSLIGENNNDA
jgi:hypothetical protein